MDRDAPAPSGAGAPPEPPPDELEGGAGHVIDFLLSSLVAPALLVDGGGLVESASPAAMADLRRSPDQLSGMPIEHAIGVSTRQLADNAADLHATRLSSVGRTTLRWRASGLDDLRRDGGWIVEFTLENAATHDGDLDARSVRLDILLEDLTERFEALNRYLGLISHDLQAPTRRLLSFVELLRDDMERGEVRTDRIEAIERSATHMLRLTSELLTYSRLGRRPLTLEAVEAQDVLDATLEQLAERITASGATIEVPEPLPAVTASPTFLSVVFQNLVENAITYRSAQPPRISVTWSPAGDDVRIEVADNGVGIPVEHRHAVFQPFRRLGPNDQAATGLGLATVRDLVNRFGGSIIVSAGAPGEGTTFQLTLPRST